MIPALRKMRRNLDQVRCAPPIAAALLTFSGCFGVFPERTASVGTTANGFLWQGHELPEAGRGFVRARRGEETRFGTPGLIAALERAFASVDDRFDGTIGTRVGDLSGPRGGRHPRHGSHRTGRDADVLFYATDAAGRSIQSSGFRAFSRFGVARDGSDVVLFDDARNWHFVRTLLLDPAAQVQWIFVSRGLKARLLRYALAYEPSKDAILRAAYALLQPEKASPHDDHFHVRIYCSPIDRAAGCLDRGPRWPWWRPDVERIEAHDGSGLDDASLLDELLEGL